MAPREAKVTPKIQRMKSTTAKKIPTTSGIKRPIMSAKKPTTTKQTALKGNNTVTPKKKTPAATAATPQLKDNKTSPSTVTKSAKKPWQRRPKPAHSGVPVPEKMKRLLQQKLIDADSSF